MSRAVNLPEGRKGQLLALGLLILVLALVWTALLQPLLEFYADREAALADARDRAGRLAVLSGQLPRLRAELASHGAENAAAEATIEGDSDALAEAKLQQIIEGLAATSGTALSSFEPVAAKTNGQARRIGITVSATCAYDQLVHLLAGIEQGSPKMLIGDLQIHNFDAGGTDKNHPIETSFTVYAFRKGEAGS